MLTSELIAYVYVYFEVCVCDTVRGRVYKELLERVCRVE